MFFSGESFGMSKLTFKVNLSTYRVRYKAQRPSNRVMRSENIYLLIWKFSTWMHDLSKRKIIHANFQLLLLMKFATMAKFFFKTLKNWCFFYNDIKLVRFRVKWYFSWSPFLPHLWGVTEVTFFLYNALFWRYCSKTISITS